MNDKLNNTDTQKTLEGEAQLVETEDAEGLNASEDSGQAATEAQTEETRADVDEDEDGAGEAEEQPVDPLEELQAKVASLEDSLLRAKADYQNLQRRSTQERSEAVGFANAELMRSLVGVLDDFERSLEAAQDSDNLASVVDGVRLVYDNFLKALRLHGLESIQAAGEAFDPHIHEAMMQQPSDDHPSNTVLQEVAKGYRLRDRILRPAKVIVSKAVEDQEEAQEDAPADQEDGKKKKKKKRK
ncbi:MAG: nucleotide exchange factor GrpE [Phycisphaerales bacterium]|nr:MAG: nucleotide exchange factor GrpE [Phycisphaerales bacterium]